MNRPPRRYVHNLFAHVDACARARTHARIQLANKETSLFASLPNGQALELRKVLAVVATKLDCVLVQPDPDRSHIQAVLEDLEARTFSDMADLTDSHLLPLLAVSPSESVSVLGTLRAALYPVDIPCASPPRLRATSAGRWKTRSRQWLST